MKIEWVNPLLKSFTTNIAHSLNRGLCNYHTASINRFNGLWKMLSWWDFRNVIFRFNSLLLQNSADSQ